MAGIDRAITQALKGRKSIRAASFGELCRMLGVKVSRAKLQQVLNELKHGRVIRGFSLNLPNVFIMT